jgi:hypothetical protein
LTIKIVQTDDFSEIQKGVEFKKLGDIKMKFQFYKGYLYDEDIDPKNKFLDCNNLKLYFMEKILMDLCEDDVKKIGCDELMLHGLNITFTRKQTKKTVNQKDGKPEKLRTVTSNTSDFSIDYKIDFIKLNDVKVFFQSIEENNEKQIAVFYHTGFVCSGTTQRIKKLGWNDAAYFETENEKALTSCSDWKVVTTGTDRVIRNLGNRVATSLSTYLRVTEKFIRNQSFNTLWEMCKTSA